MTPPQHSAFPTRYEGRSLRLTSEVEIFPAHDPSEPIPQGKTYQALYDTGATHSAISPKVVSDLQLASIGATNVGVGGGALTTTSHLVNIALPNRVMCHVSGGSNSSPWRHRCSDRDGHHWLR